MSIILCATCGGGNNPLEIRDLFAKMFDRDVAGGNYQIFVEDTIGPSACADALECYVSKDWPRDYMPRDDVREEAQQSRPHFVVTAETFRKLGKQAWEITNGAELSWDDPNVTNSILGWTFEQHL